MRTDGAAWRGGHTPSPFYTYLKAINCYLSLCSSPKAIGDVAVEADGGDECRIGIVLFFVACLHSLTLKSSLPTENGHPLAKERK